MVREGSVVKAIFAAALLLIPALPASSAIAEGNVNQQDRTFVREAAASGQQEVAAGRLAEKQAGAPAVREFGRWMVTDHTLLDMMLRERARQADLTLQSAPGSQSKLDALRSLHDRQFDQPYIAEQVRDHERAVALFQQEILSGENRGLKSLARTSLPLLQEHLVEAKDLQTQVLATAPGGNEMSVPASAPPATTKRATTSTAQGPMVKGMNQAAKQRVETEGK
jgi:putative membrane protein